MNKSIVRLGTFLWTLALAGSVSAAHIQPGDAPNYEISHPNYQYSITVASLRDIDFKNFENLTVFRLRNNKPEPGVRLVDGKFSQRYPEGGGEEVVLDLVRFIDGGQRAVIDVLWKSCGGSCSESGLVQVFALNAGHPVVVEQIAYERHAPNTGVELDAQSRILTVSGRSSEPSPNCCPKSLDVMNYEWDGGGFVFKNSKRMTLPDAP
jgi:hypothetical protein